MVNHVTKRQV